VISLFLAGSVGIPRDIIAGPDGNLWFMDELGHSVGRVTPAGVFSQFHDGRVVRPYGITIGPDGNVWFPSEVDRGAIGRLNISQAQATVA
jgi:virginiamycin B lyase